MIRELDPRWPIHTPGGEINLVQALLQGAGAATAPLKAATRAGAAAAGAGVLKTVERTIWLPFSADLHPYR